MFGPVIGSNAIHTALARMDVARQLANDEFEALGLGRFRMTRDWEEAARSGG